MYVNKVFMASESEFTLNKTKNNVITYDNIVF